MPISAEAADAAAAAAAAARLRSECESIGWRPPAITGATGSPLEV